MSTNRILIAIIAVVAAGLLAFALVEGTRLFGGGEAPRPKAIVATSEADIGGPFTLVDTAGRTVSSDDLKGKFLLIFFGFTFCPDICPTELQTVGHALDMLGARAERITPVFITVDPARDTPAAMKDYVTAFHPRMVGLTGTRAQTDAAAKAFRVYYRIGNPSQPGAMDYLVDHTSFLYLIGPDGDLRAVLRGGTGAESLAGALRYLLP